MRVDSVAHTHNTQNMSPYELCLVIAIRTHLICARFDFWLIQDVYKKLDAEIQENDMARE